MCGHQLQLRFAHRHRIQLGEIVVVGWRQRGAGPENCLACHGIEMRGVQLAQHGQIVVARHAERRALHDERYTFIGLGAVSHDVPETPEFVVFSARPLQHRFQRSQIAMYVGKDQCAHGGN